MELDKDYDCDILYHPRKANVVADALSRRGPGQLYSSTQISRELADEMVRAGIELVIGRLANITLQSTLLERIREGQLVDAQLQKVRENVLVGVAKDYSTSENGLLRYQGQICVPVDEGIDERY